MKKKILHSCDRIQHTKQIKKPNNYEYLNKWDLLYKRRIIKTQQLHDYIQTIPVSSKIQEIMTQNHKIKEEIEKKMLVIKCKQEILNTCEKGKEGEIDSQTIEKINQLKTDILTFINNQLEIINKIKLIKTKTRKINSAILEKIQEQFEDWQRKIMEDWKIEE